MNKKLGTLDDKSALDISVLDTSVIAAATVSAVQSAAEEAIAAIRSASSASTGVPKILVDDTIDHLVNAAEAPSVEFTVSGLAAGASGTVSFTDAAHHEVTVEVAGNGQFAADLSSLTDGTVTSSLSVTDVANHTLSVSGNSVSLDTDKDLHPTLSVDASNPAHVTFSIAGLEGDEHGTMTFTDSLGHQAVVDVGSNGNYTTSLSSLAVGKVSYLLTETDPAGNAISIDPPVLLGGDGSAGAPGGAAQLPHLLDSYATRPSWQVAGVDYAVGVNQGVTLKIPTAGNLPPGVTLGNGVINVDGSNVTLNGYDLTNYTVMIKSDASGTITISNCAATTGVNIRSTVGATANLVVQNCTLDGGGMASDPNFQLIKVWCPLTVEYSVIKNAPGGIYADAPLTALYNVMEGFAWITGAHANAIYVTGGDNPAASTLIAYNTIYSEASQNAQGFPIGIGAAIAFFGDGGNFYNSTVANNTVISAMPGAASYLIGFYVNSGASATGGNVQDNFVASVNGFNNSNSGAFGAFYTGSSGVVQATYANNIDMSNGKVIDGNNVETASTGSSPSTPVIAAFSSDSGVVGDGITDHNTLTLTGTAVANSTVKVFDGTTQIGTATANSSGAWTFTTAALADGTHKITATATSSGTTSAASSSLSVTIDTAAPNAPIIASAAPASNNTFLLKGTAEANSSVLVFDGTSQVGTVAANNSGVWSFATASLANSSHSFTAKAMDVAGNISVASVAIPASAAFPTPNAPTIVSYSPDSGVVGDGITNNSTPILTGTAAANSTVSVFDGATKIGTAITNSSGSWTLATTKLADGSHSLTATDTVSGTTSAASSALSLTIDTVAPNAPFETGASIVSGTAKVQLTGTAEANSTLQVFDGTTQVGTATANNIGSWSLTTGTLASGSHSFATKATDAAGNIGAASAALAVTIPSTPSAPAAPTIASFSTDSGVVGDHVTNDNTLTLNGTAVANSTVKVFDGSAQIGTATARFEWILELHHFRPDQRGTFADSD